MIPYLILSSLIAFFSTMIGGLLALRFHNFNVILTSFTGGTLIAVSTVDIMPETINIASQISLPLVILFIFSGLGFVFLLFLEFGHHSPTSMRSVKQRKLRGSMAASEMVTHSLLEGVAIGVAFEIDLSVGLAVALAIILHDISDGMSIVAIMGASDHSSRASFLILLLESSATGLGIAFSYFFHVPSNIVVVVLAFIAGGLFFIGAIDMLPHAVSKSDRIFIPTFFGVSGFALICLIIVTT